jgi:hypothetical protein
MVHLTTATGSFHGRVLAARLGSEGIPVELRGLSDGPYPLPGPVEILVRADMLELAREILLGDAVDAAFAEQRADHPGGVDLGSLARQPRRARSRRLLGAVAVLLVLAAVIAASLAALA